MDIQNLFRNYGIQDHPMGNTENAGVGTRETDRNAEFSLNSSNRYFEGTGESGTEYGQTSDDESSMPMSTQFGPNEPYNVYHPMTYDDEINEQLPWRMSGNPRGALPFIFSSFSFKK
jgi:hypothetical protein